MLDELEAIVTTFENLPDLRFRGESKSKYTMLTSLQGVNMECLR